MLIMPKKCTDCGSEAKFRIKDTPEFYCLDCAEEHFADLQLLIKVEEEALKLKQVIEQNQEM